MKKPYKVEQKIITEAIKFPGTSMDLIFDLNYSSFEDIEAYMEKVRKYNPDYESFQIEGSLGYDNDYEYHVYGKRMETLQEAEKRTRSLNDLAERSRAKDLSEYKRLKKMFEEDGD